MIELIFLLITLGVIRQIAERRGSNGWLFAAVTLVGYIVVSIAATRLLGSGPNILACLAWLGLCFLAAFVLTGGGRRLSSSWQCPDCRLHNEPTTLVCPCGYRYPQTETE